MAADRARAGAQPPSPAGRRSSAGPDWIHALLLFWDGRLDEARERLGARCTPRRSSAATSTRCRSCSSSSRGSSCCSATGRRRGGTRTSAGVRRRRAGRWASGRTRRRSWRWSRRTRRGRRGARARSRAGLALAEQLGVQPAALELLADARVPRALAGRAAPTAHVRRARASVRGERAARAGAVPLAGGRDRGLGGARARRRRARGRAGPRPARRGCGAWPRAATRCSVRPAPPRRRTRPAGRRRGDATSQPFERARHAARARRARAARPAVAAPLGTRSARRSTPSSALGAPLWAEQARAELARSAGARQPTDALTPTERRVAELIAAGRTYQEAADELFISPKTVQWNLSKVYRKLGIRRAPSCPAGASKSRPSRRFRAPPVQP